MSSTITLGGIEVPLVAGNEVRQSYEVIGGVARRRMLNGAALQQTHWTKLRTIISGTGWLPDGLAAINYAGTLTLRCAAPRSIRSASNVITLPTARRTDTGYTPAGFAIPAGGASAIATSCTVVSHVATLGVVSGAAWYEARYWPELTVYASPPRTEFDRNRGDWAWTIEAEEA
jgi:hypothetical protein